MRLQWSGFTPATATSALRNMTERLANRTFTGADLNNFIGDQKSFKFFSGVGSSAGISCDDDTNLLNQNVLYVNYESSLPPVMKTKDLGGWLHSWLHCHEF